MKNSNKSDIVTPKDEEKSHSITAIQNNFNFAQIVNIKELTILAQKYPELADRYMDIVEKSQEQLNKTNEELLELEKNEQKIRLEEIPFIRKYTFRGQIFAITISILGLGVSAYFGYLNLDWRAVIAPITIPIGILAIKFIGEKAKNTIQPRSEE